MPDYFPRWAVETLEDELQRMLPRPDAARWDEHIQRLRVSIREKRRVSALMAALMSSGP